MLRHIILYGLYLRANWLSLMQYRLDFAVKNISGLTLNLVLVAGVGIIFSRVGEIGGWSFHQVLFIYALGMVCRAVWHLLWVDTLSIGLLVRRGGLDRLLVRPLNPLFQIMAGYLDDDDWGELLVGLVGLTVAGRELGLVEHGGQVLLLGLFVLSGALIYSAIHLAANTTAFWLVSARSLDLLAWELDNFSRYPLNIFGTGIRFLLTWVVPYGFAGFYPAMAVFGETRWALLGWATPLVGLGAFALAYRFWLYGLASYQGTGT